MKRIIILTLTILMTLILPACGKDTGDQNNKEPNDDKTTITQKDELYSEREISIDDVRNAQETDASLFEYIEVDGGVSIIGFKGTEEIVVIPEKIDDKLVVSIGNNAFINQKTITGLRFNESMMDIGANACENCSNLRIVLFGKSVKNIAEFAFNGCTSLEQVDLNEGLETMGMLSFGNTNMSELYIPGSVLLIDMPFTAKEGKKLTIISIEGSEAEKYVSLDGESFNLEFKVK